MNTMSIFNCLEARLHTLPNAPTFREAKTFAGVLITVEGLEHRTLQDAKALAEFHHEKLGNLIRQHGRDAVPWRQLQQEKLAFEEQLSAGIRAEIEEKWRRLDAGWKGEPRLARLPLMSDRTNRRRTCRTTD
jgi:hypothetical protein